MGTSKFFYYPKPDARRLVTIDLGEVVGELFSDFEFDIVDANRRNGGINRSVGRQREIVNIQRDRLALSENLAVQFVALQNHLDRGGVCGFCADSSKAYAFPLLKKPESGDTTILCHANPFTDMVGSIDPQEFDYITLETQSPSTIREQTQVKNNQTIPRAGGLIELKDRIVFTYPRKVFMRHYRFWPLCLRRPASEVGRNIITNERGFLFSLDIRLFVDLSALFAFHHFDAEIGKNPDSLPGTTDNVPPTKGGRDPLPFDRPDIERNNPVDITAEDEFSYADGGSLITFGE